MTADAINAIEMNKAPTKIKIERGWLGGAVLVVRSNTADAGAGSLTMTVADLSAGASYANSPDTAEVADAGSRTFCSIVRPDAEATSR